MRIDVLNWPRTTKKFFVVSIDVVLAIFSTWLAFTLRLDVPHRPFGYEWLTYFASPMLAVPVFVRCGLYRAIFRYTGIAAILTTAKAVAIYGVALAPIIWLLFQLEGVPRSLILLQPLIFLLLVSSSRTLGWHWLTGLAGRPAKRLLVYGAGAAGVQTAAGLASTQDYAMLGFIDDDAAKQGRTINDLPVYAAADASSIVGRLAVTDILLALPSVSRQRRNQIIGQLQSLPVRIRSLPGLADLASGRVTLTDFQDLDIEDLLGRDPVVASAEMLDPSIAGNVVLVTGAGGSIGSELCRQIVFQRPSRLVLLDHSEFALYAIHQELTALVERLALNVAVTPVLASVCNFDRLASLCIAHAPMVVYHAAAYKHVPMVEENPGEGILNNVLGTLNMARAAVDARVPRFVLVSTDKAVRPTNVMGASKRVAEMVLQSLAANGAPVRTCFSMVRFGNVLGSSGSVVPRFRAQIAAGGPVTVTHPDVTRYFMTIPEAAQLVLHAGAMAASGDLFVLDMGQPVKVLALARRMVALSGLTCCDDKHPSGDIAIDFTGLRPGEKLYEELLIGENPLPTPHPRIIKAREDFMGWPELHIQLQSLFQAARLDDIAAMKRVLQHLVPGYVPQKSVFSTST